MHKRNRHHDFGESGRRETTATVEPELRHGGACTTQTSSTGHLDQVSCIDGERTRPWGNSGRRVFRSAGALGFPRCEEMTETQVATMDLTEAQITKSVTSTKSLLSTSKQFWFARQRIGRGAREFGLPTGTSHILRMYVIDIKRYRHISSKLRAMAQNISKSLFQKAYWLSQLEKHKENTPVTHGPESRQTSTSQPTDQVIRSLMG